MTIAALWYRLALLGCLGWVAGFSPSAVGNQGRVRRQQVVVTPFPVQLYNHLPPLHSNPSPHETNNTPTFRRVRNVQKYARIPVWPAWNGVFLWLVGKVFPQFAAQLEDKITGRVCPNFFQDSDETSPFIMLVHHCHTFAPIDPLRFVQRLFFPEGFPAHPHRGFITLTYFLDGGFRHRDSLGIEQIYGQHLKDVRHHSQWLFTGAGLLHEEMFYQTQWWHWQRQELYQLWINVPGRDKLNEPYLLLLGDEKETPVVQQDGVICRILAGKYSDYEAGVPTASDLSVLHVSLQSGATWTYSLPETYETLIIYMRKGRLDVIGDNDENDTAETIPTHYTAFFSPSGKQLKVKAGDSVTDFMVLAGTPLNEPVSAKGSMVMRFPHEIDQAYRDYQLGLFGAPWPHALTREEWLAHVERNPSAYRRSTRNTPGETARLSRKQTQSKL